MQSSNVSRIKHTTQRGFCASLLIAALALCISGPAQAALLNLTQDFPDVSSNFINVAYTEGSDSLTASGFATNLVLVSGGADNAIAGGSFDLSASVDDSGSLSSGNISIGGTILGLGFNSGTLLTGTLSDIGFVDGGGDPLEFLFSVTGGDLSSIYGGTGGVILSSSGFTGWGADFTNSPFAGLADTFAVSPVPVPAAVWLFGSALLGLVGYGRQSRRKQQA